MDQHWSLSKEFMNISWEQGMERGDLLRHWTYKALHGLQGPTAPSEQ